MAEYQLFHGDCLAIMPELDAASVDLIIADIPSGRTNCAWDVPLPFDAMWRAIAHVARPRAAIVLLGCTQPYTSEVVQSNRAWFRQELIWEKTAPTGFLDARRKPLDSHENILIFGRQRPAYYPQKWRVSAVYIDRRKSQCQGRASAIYNRMPRDKLYIDDGTRFPLSVIPIASTKGYGRHETEKPLELLEYLIKTYSAAGELVMDFCMGSGTAGHACANTGRRFIGIEKDSGYFATAAARIADAYAPLGRMELAAAAGA